MFQAGELKGLMEEKGVALVGCGLSVAQSVKKMLDQANQTVEHISAGGNQGLDRQRPSCRH
jgi:hypothetical protein